MATPSHGIANSWLDWVRAQAGSDRYMFEPSPWCDGEDLELLGYLIQASAERPADFERVFLPVLGAGVTNPLTSHGAGAISDIVRNGIFDDWEIFLHWRDDGYAVVPEHQRTPQDARFRAAQATQLLDALTGGRRTAPGAADEAALVQSMYECENQPRHRPG